MRVLNDNRFRSGDRQSPAPQRERTPYLASLSGLRGLLAFWVVSLHVMPGGIGPFKVTQYGYIAVDLFFIMSGFVLMHVHNRDFHKLDWPGVRKFYLLRWWRTYPVHIATCVLALGITLLMGPPPPDLLRLLQSLVFIVSWPVDGADLNVPLWSLRVEWLGYLAFPVLAFLLVPLRTAAAVLAIAAVSLADIVFHVGSGDVRMDATAGPLAIARMAAGFASGCLLWVVYTRTLPRGGLPSDLFMLGTIGSIAVIWLVLFPIYSFPFLPVFVYCAAVPGPWTKALLTNKMALFMGRISFSVYLCHYPIVTYVERLQPADASRPLRLLVDMAVLAVIVLTATLLTYTVEEPLYRYGRVVASGSRTVKVPQA